MRKRFIKIIFIALLLSTCKELPAQDRHNKLLDSLLAAVPTQKEDSTKALVLINITRLKMGSAQNTGNWNEAIEWGQKALQISTKVNYQFGIGRSNVMLGQCWTQKGNYAEATKYFYAGLKLSLKNGNKILRVATAANLADCYQRLENYAQAIKYQILAYQTVIELNNNGPADLQQLALGLAQLYAKANNPQEALTWYQKALPEDPRLFYEGQISLDMADIQLQMKQYDQALKSLRAAVQVFPERFKRKTEMETKGVAGQFYQQFGEAYFKIGTLTKGNECIAAYQEAVKHLKKSIPLLTEGAGGKEAQMKSYELLKQASEAVNDYENALKYTKLYNNIRDSIYNKQTYLKMADLKVQFGTEKAALDMKSQREKEQMEEAALRESMLAGQRLQQEKTLAAEKIHYEKELAEQRLQKEVALAEEELKHDKAIAEEKARQEIMKAEKQRINNMLLMGLGLVVITSVFFIILIRQQQTKKRVVEKAEAIHKMAELELQSLRSQLNPHFMFNSLNSIQELILMEENDKSHSYLARFSKLLRMLLENAEKPFIPLQKELDFLQLYLGLENLRVPDLQYSVSTDPNVNTEETLIPNMILQPYIENAIWHGLSHKSEDKQLQIRIFRENGSVNYEIEDNGVGRKKAAELKGLFRQKHNSRGMELLSKRFKLLNKGYSSEITTQITDVIKNHEVAGTLVTINVPVNTWSSPVYKL